MHVNCDSLSNFIFRPLSADEPENVQGEQEITTHEPPTNVDEIDEYIEKFHKEDVCNICDGKKPSNISDAYWDVGYDLFWKFAACGFCKPYVLEKISVIMKTCPCNVYPFEPHFYIAKLGYAGVYLFFLIFAPKHRLWVLVVPTIYVLSKNKKNIKIFQLKIFSFYSLKKALFIAWASFRNVYV